MGLEISNVEYHVSGTLCGQNKATAILIHDSGLAADMLNTPIVIEQFNKVHVALYQGL
jgi:hypothetical protein